MISAVFVDRPRLAIVISVVLTIAGLLSFYVIPIAQYPDIVPPQASVTTSATVISPMIEQRTM
jgi:multidrug efflux pump subunit AcrB